MWLGNVEADDLAGQRVDSLFNPAAESALQWLDARTWKFQTRLLDVFEWWVSRPQFAPPKISTCRPATKKQWFQTPQPRSISGSSTKRVSNAACAQLGLCLAGVGVISVSRLDASALGDIIILSTLELFMSRMCWKADPQERLHVGCGSRTFLCKLPKSQLTAPCKQHPRSG